MIEIMIVIGIVVLSVLSLRAMYRFGKEGRGKDACSGCGRSDCGTCPINKVKQIRKG